MNKQDLNQLLDFLVHPQGELQTMLFALLFDGRLMSLDVRNDDLAPIGDMFSNFLVESVINKDDFLVIPLSDADERKNCFYEYDLLDRPQELDSLSEIENNHVNNFDFRNEDLSEIKALVIVLGDNEHHVCLYKTISAIEIIGRGGYLLWKAHQRFERFEDKMLRISCSAQILYVENTFIVLDLNILEKTFGFHEIIKREAECGLAAIGDIGIVNNIEALRELMSDMSFARKLTKVAQYSPVLLNHIPNASIIAFSKTHPALKGKMKYTEDNSQFILDTKVSKNLLVKMLNDDFLTSDLTKLYYDSLAKDNIVEAN